METIQAVNSIGTKIDFRLIAKTGREMYMPELMGLLKSQLMKFWSWGSHAFRAESSKYTKYFRMTVSGHLHKGHVWIFLNGMDLFDVYLTTNQGTIKEIIEGLYFDQLVDTIDEKIERIPEYTD